MTRPIYLDYMATTPVDPRVIESMLLYLGPAGHFGNAASHTHDFGREAARAIERARHHVAALIGADDDDIVFTSGATEANNLAILGASLFYQRKGRHVITMATEHQTVLSACHQLEKNGFEVTYLLPQADGLLDKAALEAALRADTVLVSIMHANNEIGVIQDIASIGHFLHKKGVIFHVDASQSLGKIALDVKQFKLDLVSFSAHKVYGPKGIGALYVCRRPRRIRLCPQSFGGGQEDGLRAGTLPTHQIVAFGEACALARIEGEAEQERLLAFRHEVWQRVRHLPGVALNGSEAQRVAGNLNIRFDGLDNSQLLQALPELAFSTASACLAAKAQPSYVLRALGLSDSDAQSSIRLSLGRFTTRDEVQRLIEVLLQKIPQLQVLKRR
jgi:cysteine desulfurase